MSCEKTFKEQTTMLLSIPSGKLIVKIDSQ